MAFSYKLQWRVFAVALSVVLLNACNRKQEEVSNSADYINYISAYTAGLISKSDQIRIVLAKPSEKFTSTNAPLDDEVLTFSPKLKGNLRWFDSRTLLFTPDDQMNSGEQYQATLKLKALFSEVPDNLREFVFNFQIIEQSYMPVSMQLKTYSSNNLSWYRLEGEIVTSDVADIDEIAQLLNAKQGKKEFKIRWQQATSRKNHFFVLDSVARTEDPGKVDLQWDEKVTASEWQQQFEIPALGDFKVVGVQVIMVPEQSLRINFSDPLDAEQNLNGLVSIEGVDNLQFTINDTELEVFPPKSIYGDRMLRVYPGIKNIAGYAFENTYETSLHFEDVKPAVELIGSGNIVPQSSGLTLPFKAVNLSAVDVHVLKIFSNNVPQFLQVNQLEGDYQLRRVGRPVAYKRIDLQGTASNLKAWNTFSIDLAELVKPEPGAIYRVELKFKRAYSLYACDNEENNTDNTVSIEEEALNTADYDNPDNYYWDDYYDYYDYYEDYDYRQRDNPCNSAYYNSRKSVSRNFLATNLALTVKGSDQGNFIGFVTDIKTAQPLSGAIVEFINYQGQKMAEAKTGAEGAASFNLSSKPFLAIARYNNQFAYLRVDDGSAISLSNFDVTGDPVQKGLKGFIYAERGVWRPGDTVHTQFMLEDAAKSLPQEHPVIFEVRNPDGKLVDRQVKTNNLQGIYSFPFVTESNAPTGFYSSTVRVGGVNFHKSLRIETIKPNRLKVKLDFDKTVLTDENEQVKLHANWLTGAKAGGLKADVMMQVRQKRAAFKGFEKFDFQDVTRSFYASENEVFKGVLNSEGDAQPTLKIGEYRNVPGMLEAVFVTRVFEPGGDASFDRMAIDLAPYDHFVGLQPQKPTNTPWLQTDAPITIQVATVTPQGKPANRKVAVQVYDIDWSWWWSSGRNGMGNYLNSSYARKIYDSKISTVKGKGAFNFTVKYPNWGNFLVRVCDEESGHCASQIIYVDWPMSRSRNNRPNPGAPTMLTFTADKEEYTGGDIAKLIIPTGEQGRLLISLETGSQVLKHMWVDAKPGQTEVEIPITDEMTPNVYAFVSYIQPHAQTANDLPIRLYGVVPLKVNNDKTRLHPEIETPEEWKPEKQAIVKVSEANRRPMVYTLAIVDEGLLDITRFKTPDPWSQFYAREALGVKTWDFFDEIVGAFGGVVQKNFAIGGDQEFDPSGKKRLNRFTPVVRVLGPFKLDAGQTASHAFNMPNYIGSVRVMVVAREDEAYGHAEKAVPVRKPLMVLATLPRVVGPGERLQLPVQVFAMKDHVKDVDVNLKANGYFKLSQTKQTLHFSEIGDKMAYFDLEVAEKAGKGIVDVTVTSGNEKATYQVAIEVRNPNSRESRKQSKTLAAGETVTYVLENFGMKGPNTVTVEASGIPDLNLSDALNYLIGYPHGCIEQTVSKAFPQLFLQDLTQLNDAQKQEAKSNVIYSITKLQHHQLAQGGFALWPSGSAPHDWASSYATHFLIEAKNNGYAIPAGMLDRAVRYLTNAAQTWQASRQDYGYYNYLNQAYRLYVLAISGNANLGAMNRMRKGNMSKEAAWRLAAAYVVAGQPNAAQELMTRNYITPAGYYYDATFGNAMRASSMYLETYILLKDAPKAYEQARVLAGELSNKNLYSSQSTAYALYAMHKFLKDKSRNELALTLKADGKQTTVKQAGQLYMKTFEGVKGEIEVTNTGKTELYLSVTESGIPLPGKESASNSGLQVNVSYKLLDGTPIDISHIKQGTDFKAVVTLSSNADSYKLYDMAITQVFPSGWEIINTRLLGLDDVSTASTYTYRDYRDDRVYTYFTLSRNATRTYEVRLNAAYMGTYYLPGAVVEAMYYPEVYSRSNGKWVEVEK